ncbi:unnamed protein product [Aphanomyces euteiches]
MISIDPFYKSQHKPKFGLKGQYGSNNTQLGAYQYVAPTLPRFLKMNIRNRTRQLLEFQAVARTTQRMVYLEPSREDPTEYRIVQDHCVTGGYQSKDYIYNESYALPLVQRILLGMNSSINLTAVPLTHALIVDCDYDGRYYQDTTMFKIFLVDIALQSISSIALQTMNAMRETTKLETQVGATVVSQAQLDRFRLGPDDPPDAPWLFGLTYDGATDYRTLVSLYFPYEDDTPFLETHHDGILPSNEYAWRIRATNESMSVAGYSGYYQGSKESQTNILRYLMDMTGNPIRDFVVNYYVSLSYTKDAWTWIQGLVILTVGIALNIAVMTTVFKRKMYLPDVFPTIKRHIHVRAVLLVLAFITDGFWTICEWALTAGERPGDLLVLFLVWTDVVASALGVGVWPTIPVVAFVVCHAHSDALVLALTSADIEKTVANYFTDAYVQNIVLYSTTGMNQWTRHALDSGDPPPWLVAREFAWFLAPCIGITCSLLLYKLILLAVSKFRGKRDRLQTNDSDNVSVAVSEMSGDARRAVRLLTLPSPSFLFSKDAFQMSRTIVWCAGWLLLDDMLVVYADDLLRVFARVLLGVDFGHIYCCAVEIQESRHVLIPKLIPLPVSELTWRSLVHISIETLWVKKVRDGDEQQGQSMADMSMKLKSKSGRTMANVAVKPRRSNANSVAGLQTTT